MNLSRRVYLKSLAAFGAWGAFGGSRFAALAAPFAPGGKPRLRFGVVSDIHIERLGLDEDIAKPGNALTFIRALEWFRSQNVDAVVIAGDMADLGLSEQLLAVSEAWYSVFPDDKRPDGRRVEKIFVTGNHDWWIWRSVARIYPDPAERDRHCLQRDMAGWWDKAFHEEYSPIYSKTVNGYTFIGSHWDGAQGVRGSWGAQYRLVADFMAKNGKGLDPKMPFFYVQHPHLKDTCYGSWAWGHDAGLVTKALSAYPNAIAFSGHSHYSLTDERSIWQGAFTSVGTSCLRYSCAPFESHPPEGYENAGAAGAKESAALNAAKLSPEMKWDDCRQGMLWTVYDDCIAVKRREFLSQMDLGADWVMPLPAAETKPFAFAEHAKRLHAPQFPNGAKLEVSEAKAKTRGGKGVKSVEKDAYKVVAPPVAADGKARLFELEFTAKTVDGRTRTKMVLAEGFNQSLGHKKAKLPQTCLFAKDELGEGAVAFTVTPVNSLGQRGKPLSAATTFPLAASKVRYKNDCRASANFLNFVESRHPGVVREVNALCRQGVS